MARRGEGVPGDVKPGGARQQLVGKLPRFEEFHEPLELLRILRTDVGCLTAHVLGVLHPADVAVHGLVAEARVDEDRPHHEPGRFQQLVAAVGQVRHDLQRGDVRGVLAQVQELRQPEMGGESRVIDLVFHDSVC